MEEEAQLWQKRFDNLLPEHKKLVYAIVHYYNYVGNRAVAASVERYYGGRILRENQDRVYNCIQRGETAEMWNEQLLKFIEEDKNEKKTTLQFESNRWGL